MKGTGRGQNYLFCTLSVRDFVFEFKNVTVSIILQAVDNEGNWKRPKVYERDECMEVETTVKEESKDEIADSVWEEVDKDIENVMSDVKKETEEKEEEAEDSPKRTQRGGRGTPRGRRGGRRGK